MTSEVGKRSRSRLTNNFNVFNFVFFLDVKIAQEILHNKYRSKLLITRFPKESQNKIDLSEGEWDCGKSSVETDITNDVP